MKNFLEGELLKTPHPLILERVKKRFLIRNICCYSFFRDAITNLDEDKALDVLSKFVPEWKKIIKKII